jgi:hypothetical protein
MSGGPGICPPEQTGKSFYEIKPEVARRLPVVADGRPCGGVPFRPTSLVRSRAITALLLLALAILQAPASSTPFLYFADYGREFAAEVARGRAEFLPPLRDVAIAVLQELLPDPADRATFERRKLDLRERERHSEDYALNPGLLRLRRADRVFDKPAASSNSGERK